MVYEFVAKGNYVISAGEKGTKFYILLNGRVRVLIPQINPNTDETEFIEVD